jgi:hypothetical protein
MAQRDSVDVEGLLSRNLEARLPASVKALLRPEEHAVIVLDGGSRAIVATNERVFITDRDRPTVELAYSDITDVVAQVPWFGRRYIDLSGTPAGATATAQGVTYRIVPKLLQHRAARRAVLELNALIDAENGWEDPSSEVRTSALSGGWGLSRNWTAGSTGRGGK